MGVVFWNCVAGFFVLVGFKLIVKRRKLSLKVLLGKKCIFCEKTVMKVCHSKVCRPEIFVTEFERFLSVNARKMYWAK